MTEELVRPAVDHARLFTAAPSPYLVLDAGLVVVAANAAYCAVSGRSEAELVGRAVLDVFPDDPQDPAATGSAALTASLRRVLATGQVDRMPLQRYDVADVGGAGYRERHWTVVNVPVLDDRGRVELVLHRPEEVTDVVLGSGTDALERVRLAVVAAELQAAWEAEAAATRRLSALVEVALRLSRAQSLADLAAVVVEGGLRTLGAQGGSLAVRDGNVLVSTVSSALGPGAQATYARVPVDARLPACVAAVTGEQVLLADEEACLAWGPDMPAVLADTGCTAWASLPLRTEGAVLGSLNVGWVDAHPFGAAEVEVLEALAAQCAAAVERIQRRQVERRATAAARSMSEALQHSLLTDPIGSDSLQIVARYRPAAEQVEVGGDWYDAFPTSDGTTCLVIGDVTGHDRDAAAVMGQMRNLLRGIAHVVVDPPAAVLSALDRALRSLAVGTLATAVLAKVEQTPTDAGAGLRRLRWSNAGHLPPVLVEPGGAARLLQSSPDLLLGLDPGAPRRDHEVVLPVGARVLLYTDGLVERRSATLQDGLAWLLEATDRLSSLPVGDLCDALLDEVGDRGEDDVALLALHVGEPAAPPPAG